MRARARTSAFASSTSPSVGDRFVVRRRGEGLFGVRVALRALGVVAVAALLGGCVGPARTVDDYERKASTSLHDIRSAVETARLAVDAATGDRATGPYLS